jgi:hypothetical protein
MITAGPHCSGGGGGGSSGGGCDVNLTVMEAQHKTFAHHDDDDDNEDDDDVDG